MPEPILKDPIIGRAVKNAFRIDHLIGEGAMNRVYHAEQIRTKRQVAIKALRPWFNNVDYIDSYLRAARLYGQIDHPNVVGVFDSGREDQMAYVAMEYVEGSPLSEVVNEKGLSLANLLWVMQQVCAGVQAAHKLNLLHGDIKPSNIMLCKSSDDVPIAKVLDFGISRPLDEENAENTHQGMAMGLPGFISPEQISGAKDLDVRSDIYSLGAILYYMLAGKNPYDGINPDMTMQRQLVQPPERLRVVQLADPYAWKLQPVIFKAMEIDREKRYPNVMAFWQDILKQVNPEPALDLNDDAAHQPAATKYMFVFKGELEEGADIVKAKTALQTILNVDAQKAEKLFTQERVVIRKDISLDSAKRFGDLFKIAGAIGYVEEVDSQSASNNADDSNDVFSALPSADIASPILAKDIPGIKTSETRAVFQAAPELVAVNSHHVEIKTEVATPEAPSMAEQAKPALETAASPVQPEPIPSEQEVAEAPIADNTAQEQMQSARPTLQKEEPVKEQPAKKEMVAPVATATATTTELPSEPMLSEPKLAEAKETESAETTESESSLQAAAVEEQVVKQDVPAEPSAPLSAAQSPQPSAAPVEQEAVVEHEAVKPEAVKPSVAPSIEPTTPAQVAAKAKPQSIQEPASPVASENEKPSAVQTSEVQASIVSAPSVVTAPVSAPKVASQAPVSAPADVTASVAVPAVEPAMQTYAVAPQTIAVQHTPAPQKRTVVTAPKRPYLPRSNVRVTSLKFGSSSFEIADVREDSVGEYRIAPLPSPIKYYLYGVGIAFAFATMGITLITPELRTALVDYWLM